MDDNKPLLIIIVILVLLLVGLGGYIGYDKFVVEKKNSSSKMIVDDKSFDLNSIYQVTDILDRLDLAFNDCSSSYCGYLYTQKKINIDKFNQDAALYASLAYEFSHTGTVLYAYGDRVKSNLEKVFGKGIEYNPPLELSAGDKYKILYDTNNGNFAYLAPPLAPYDSRYEAYNIRTNITEDGLEITRKVFYVEYNNTGGKYTGAIIYKDHTKNVKIGTISMKDGKINSKEVVAKYGSKCKTYKYMFTEKDMSNYSLTRIETV